MNKDTDKVLCTINGFWMEQHEGFVSQPSPAWISAQRRDNPKQPLIWTEDQGEDQRQARQYFL